MTETTIKSDATYEESDSILKDKISQLIESAAERKSKAMTVSYCNLGYYKVESRNKDTKYMN